MSFQAPFEHPLKRLQQAVESAKGDILQQMGTLAVNFAFENFEKQGFQGAVLERWKPRKKETAKTKGKLILINSAHLRNGTYYTIEADGVIIRNPMPYAAIHNDGGDILHPARTGIMSFARNATGGLKLGKIQTPKQRKLIVAQNKHTIGEHTTRMPQRKFIGNSPVLNKRIEAIIVPTILKHYK